MRLGLRRTGLATAVCAFMMAATALPAAAVGTIDQDTLSAPMSSGWVVISSAQSGGANFTAGLSGSLARLDVTLRRIANPANLTLSIYAVNGSGQPTGSPLATQAVNFSGVPVDPGTATVTTIFATPTSVTQGNRYAFILSSTDSGSNAFGMKFTSTQFPGIARLSDNGSGWVSSTSPPLFATYVDVQHADPDSVPIIPLQQFAVAPGTRAIQCAGVAPPHVAWQGLEEQSSTGWGISYASWPNRGTGGWVCTRQPIWIAGSIGFS